MATLLDLLTGSLRLINAANPGEALDAVAARDALYVLNDLIEGLNLEHLTNPTGVSRVDVTCVSGQAVHTIGTGGNFNTSRPVVIDKAFVIVGGVEYEVEAIEADRWSEISDKTFRGIPTTLYYEPEFPLGKVHLYPVPDQAYGLALWCWDSLPTYTMANLSQQLVLPPGYARMYRYNLALELAPEYGKDPSVAVVNNAIESKAAVKRANHVAPMMRVDDAFQMGSCSASLSDFLGG